MEDEYRQVLLRLPLDVVQILDRQAKERGLTRNAFIIYIAKAFETGVVMIADPITWGKWREQELDQVARTARVVARKEVKLVLVEEGFTTTPYET